MERVACCVYRTRETRNTQHETSFFLMRVWIRAMCPQNCQEAFDTEIEQDLEEVEVIAVP